MSRIYWSTRDTEVEVLGSERAHMHIVTGDMAGTVLRDAYPREDHRLAAVVNHDHYAYPGLLRATHEERGLESPRIAALIQQSAQSILGASFDQAKLTFGGETYRIDDLSGNTIVATGSPVLALMAKLHGYCESHAWVDEPNREWLAEVIEQGRATNILRSEAGWEEVVELLRQVELFPGPVVTSYSVCDIFPSMSACNWMDPGWPPEMVANNSYDYGALTEEQQRAVDERGEAWDESLSSDERWDMAMAGIRKKPWLEFTPTTLTKPTFASDKSFWDVLASEEWRNG